MRPAYDRARDDTIEGTALPILRDQLLDRRRKPQTSSRPRPDSPRADRCDTSHGVPAPCRESGRRVRDANRGVSVSPCLLVVPCSPVSFGELRRSENSLSQYSGGLAGPSWHRRGQSGAPRQVVESAHDRERGAVGRGINRPTAEGIGLGLHQLNRKARVRHDRAGMISGV